MNLNRVVFCFGLLLILAFAGGCNQAKGRDNPTPAGTATPAFGRGNPVPTDSATPIVVSSSIFTPAPTMTVLFSILTSTPTITPTFIPTFTPVLPPTQTSALTQTPVPTINPAAKLKYQCLKSVTTLPKDERLEGTLVLGGEIGNYFLLNLATDTQAPLNQDTKSLYSVIISPDQKHMFYSDCNGSSCLDMVTSADGSTITIPDKKEWRNFRWLDNERLVIMHDRKPYNSVDVLNPFSGEEKEVTLDLPNPYYYHTFMNTYILISAIDPTLSRVVYFDTQGIGRLILWDISAGKMLAWLPYPVPAPDNPSALPLDIDYLFGWSPDGSQFATIAPVTFLDKDNTTPAVEELFSISRDGQIKQLTHFGAAYKYVSISEFRWSPDGRTIAFWLQTSENAVQSSSGIVQRFAILDTSTQEVSDYCLTFGSSEYSTSVWFPVWAANNQQLIIRTHSDDGKWPIMLVDLVKGFVVQIGEGMTPEGWMVSP